MNRTVAWAVFWALIALALVAAVAFSFVFLDMPLAEYSRRVFGAHHVFAEGRHATIFMACAALAAVVLAIVRLVHGGLSPFWKAVGLACVAAICTYAVNAYVFKVLFGTNDLASVLDHGARHAFNLGEGTANSGLPSGHFALTTSFVGVFMRLYRKSRLPLSLFLLASGVFIVLGGWHFLSDVIAGAMVGLSAGFLAATVWQTHEAKLDSAVLDPRTGGD
jgi:PAP2 superfamily